MSQPLYTELIMQPNANVTANLGNFGPPFEHEISGKKIKFKFIDQSVKAALEQKLIGKAKMLLKNEKNQLTDDEFKLAYESHAEACVSGKYSFGSKTMQNFLQTPNGIAMLLSICSGEPQEYWEYTLTDDPLECSLLIKKLLDLSFPSLKKIQQQQEQDQNG